MSEGPALLLEDVRKSFGENEVLKASTSRSSRTRWFA